MIAHLEGVLRELAPTRIVIDVGGVGYEVHVPLSTFTELPDVGKTLKLHIYTHAREGALQLFGFHTLPERVAFDLLLRANRVGPRLAQTILSGIEPAALLDAIRNRSVRVLCAVPGVGTKLAERMLVELGDRVGDLSTALLGEAGSDTGSHAADPGASSSVRDQTLSALLNLGYPKQHAERVLEGAEQEAGSDASIESLVRAALKRLAR